MGGAEYTKTEWKIPKWMDKYVPYLIYDRDQIEDLYNSGEEVNVHNNAPKALMCVGLKSSVDMLIKLQKDSHIR